MRRLWALLLLAAVAVPAAAQDTPRRERDTSTVRARGFSVFGPRGAGIESFQRGRLGILVDLSADQARDSIGARVAGLTHDSPAGKAGVQVGDLVVRFNGTSLARRASGDDDEDAPSRPGTRLIEMASKLDPGDSVHLDLRRGSQTLSVTVVAGESGMDEVMRSYSFDVPRITGSLRGQRLPTGPMTFMFDGGPFSDMELAKVNPALGQYFGTTEGLLVVNVGNDSTLGLKSGDVILAIGGRKPLDPAHALRILGTYEPNEDVSFDVMRMKHRISVTGKLPERRGRAWSITPNSFEFDFNGMTPWVPGPELQELRELPQLFKLPFAPTMIRPRATKSLVET